MKICVFGLWHLGSVTAACLAGAGFNTVGLDDDESVIRNLTEGHPPLFEPGLPELTRSGLASGNLSFTTNRVSVREADVVWVAFDTPVDGDDRADVPFVVDKICSLFPNLKTTRSFSSPLSFQWARSHASKRCSNRTLPEGMCRSSALPKIFASEKPSMSSEILSA